MGSQKGLDYDQNEANKRESCEIFSPNWFPGTRRSASSPIVWQHSQKQARCEEEKNGKTDMVVRCTLPHLFLPCAFPCSSKRWLATTWPGKTRQGLTKKKCRLISSIQQALSCCMKTQRHTDRSLGRRGSLGHCQVTMHYFNGTPASPIPPCPCCLGTKRTESTSF